jgi:hypothetical protein
MAASVVIGEKLVGFVTPVNVNASALREFVMKKLPSYMVPSTFVRLAQFPMNTNGKVDKMKLNGIFEDDLKKQVQVPASLSDHEMLLTFIWGALLKVEPSVINSESSFFECGGDSLSVIKMCNLARSAGFAFTVADVFSKPWLKELATMRAKDSASNVVEKKKIVVR